MADFVWTVNSLTRTNDADKVVSKADYRVHIDDPDVPAIDHWGSVEWESSSSDEGFLAFEDLTPEIVIGWIKETLGAEYVGILESQLNTRYEYAKAPTTVDEVPWATPEEITHPEDELEAKVD